MPSPILVAVHLAPARGAAVVSVEDVVAEAGAGLVGDRWHGSRHRHVSVQTATDLAEAGGVLGAVVRPEQTRRNLTLSHGELPTDPGDRLRIGDVLLEVVRVAAPCRVMESSIGPGGAAALRRRGGVICRVLEGGVLRVGDRSDIAFDPALDEE